VRLQALVEQLQPAAPAGAGRAQAFAVGLGGFQLGLGAVEVLLQAGVARLGGGQILLELAAALGHALDLAGDLLLLGGERLGLGGQPPVAGRGVFQARPTDCQLLAELGHLALQAVGFAGQGGALGHQPVEQLEVRDLRSERGALALALQHAGGRHLAFEVEGAGLHPHAFAGEEGHSRMQPGQPLGVGGGAHEEGGGQGRRQLLGES